MRISMSSRGSTKNTEKFLKRMQELDIQSLIESYARAGVQALSQATPVDSGIAAESWDYVINQSKGKCTITWTNNNVEEGFPVAIMLQYGYGTGTGGYVQGRDYINPAIAPIFDQIAIEVWKVVTSA